ncbi:MAG TPA: RES domain-containing protein [Roseiarcus sp.]|nr:RES domain-containing protein [Roseiarcus sp.]
MVRCNSHRNVNLRIGLNAWKPETTREPLLPDWAFWADAVNYEPCQALANAVRASGGNIRYGSVRDPQSGANAAILTCAAFAETKPVGDRRTWRIRLSSVGVQAICEFPEQQLEFDRGAFARDSRIAGIAWER